MKPKGINWNQVHRNEIKSNHTKPFEMVLGPLEPNGMTRPHETEESHMKSMESPPPPPNASYPTVVGLIGIYIHVKPERGPQTRLFGKSLFISTELHTPIAISRFSVNPNCIFCENTNKKKCQSLPSCSLNSLHLHTHPVSLHSRVINGRSRVPASCCFTKRDQLGQSTLSGHSA